MLNDLHSWVILLSENKAFRIFADKTKINYLFKFWVWCGIELQKNSQKILIGGVRFSALDQKAAANR